MHIDASELRAELARRGWRQSDLASAAGVSRSLVGLVCNGLRPSSRALDAILAALGPVGAERVLAHRDGDGVAVQSGGGDGG